MIQINQALSRIGATSDEVHPHHVFQLVAGTSTGGLIALMLAKIGLTVDECIKQYEELSRVIFGKRHFRGRMTRGLAPAKYSGKCLRNCIRGLLRDRQLPEDLSMSHPPGRIAWYAPVILITVPFYAFAMDTSHLEPGLLTYLLSAVICREHCSPSQYSTLKSRAVPICSLPCKDKIVCKVCDAARATSAAPTFFPVMKIKDRFFADGGLAHNNPSFAIYFHYTGTERKRSTRPRNTPSTAPQFSPHGDLDCSRVRFTNIGTGAKVEEVEPGKRDRLAGLIPGVIRRGVFLKQTLADIAVNSEEKAHVMREFQALNQEIFQFERFDANHGVSNIKLDAYKALGEIRRKTEGYLQEQETKDLLEEVGSAIADDYLNTLRVHGSSVQSTDIAVGDMQQSDQTPKLLTASPLLVNGLSSHENSMEAETKSSTLKHVNVVNGGPSSLTKSQSELHLALNGRAYSRRASPDNWP